MKIFRSPAEIEQYKKDGGVMAPVACALGNFDGIHKGHQKLIYSAADIAKEKNMSSAVFTFTDHPINVMSGHILIKNILNFEDKARLLEKAGIDFLFSFNFSREIRTMSPEDFAGKLLAETLNVKHAVCGFNYNFGYKAGGDHNALISFGAKRGFSVTVIEPVQIEGVTVSSTLIRACIEKGAVESYKAYTGRAYRIYGNVMEGEHNGRKMGFPTVNLNLDSGMALPANGVYTTRTFIDKKPYPSITNVGNKPTIGDFAKNAETHIFDFRENIYGKRVKIEFIRMQRAEKKFESMEELAKRINSDCIEARNYHKSLDLSAED